jgi:NADH-quinone oxidoreductase subunit C
MAHTTEQLQDALHAVLGERIRDLTHALGELTLTVSSQDYLDVMQTLRDHPDLSFEQLIDLCGMDYSAYRDGDSPLAQGLRYAVVSHLLSITHNCRLRVRVFAPQEDMPIVASVNSIWSSANWYEREAFDLYGIVFEGHEDLRQGLPGLGSCRDAL